MKIAAFLRNLSTACALTLLAATTAGAAPLDFKDILVEISSKDLLAIDYAEVFVPRPQFDACADFNAPLCIKEVWQESWIACVQPFGQEKIVAYECGARRTVTRRCEDRTWHEETSYADDQRFCFENAAYLSLCNGIPGIVRSQDALISATSCN